MKSSLMILAALSLGTAAVAQDSTMQPTTPGAAPMTTPTTPTTPDASMPTTPAPTQDSATPSAPAPGDASSNMSTPAPAPMPMASDTAPQPATADYPACSRTMTDKCVQKGGMPMKHKMHRK